MTIESKHDELDRITSAIEGMAEESGWPLDLVYKINLVLEELTLNIMNYGYTDDEVHLIDVSVKTENSRITIEIVDDGRPFNPIADAPRPDLEGPMMDRRIGGWGVHIVRTIMDDVSYVRADNKNRMKLVANL
jgi:anti-sigma regulatory factor (Ser/Thr protein kinase)